MRVFRRLAWVSRYRCLNAGRSREMRVTLELRNKQLTFTNPSALMASATGYFKYGYPTPGPQNPKGHEVMNHTFLLSKSEFNEARRKTEYDIIIIGSGFCALAVAERALKNNPACKILILERGTCFLLEHFQNMPLPLSSTLGGLSETFPWTLAAETAQGKRGVIRWQHGMVPFFGGRSTTWSAWCPRPTPKEMHGWPEETKRNARQYFEAAEKLLNVRKADEVDSNDPQWQNFVSGHRPVYGLLQKALGKLMKNATKIENVYRAEPAPLASKSDNRVDFEKFSVPGKLLELTSKQASLRKGGLLHVATNCVVEQIHQQDETATALETSRGVVPIGDARLVLAMGTLPPTTLVRNSFSGLGKVGERFSAHFISSITARIPRGDLEGKIKFGDPEIGAFYIAGTAGGDYKKQFHVQMSALSNKHPEKNSECALRYMPDVVATASMQQLQTSKDYVIFVCAVLGELDVDNEDNWFRHNPKDTDTTTNSILQVAESDNDRQIWDAMDTATFEILEQTLSPNGADRVEYWHGQPETGSWGSSRPVKAERRVDALVHESSTLYIGEEETAPVDLEYRLRGSSNVFITGAGLWPRGGSWNPTMVMVAMAQHLADLLTNKAESK